MSSRVRVLLQVQVVKMQHNVDGRRKKKRQVVDNIQPHSSSYYGHLQQPAASAPLLSRLRNFNSLALTSIGSFFSGPTIAKTTAHLHQDEEFSGHGTFFSCRNGLNADANRDSGCFWLEDPQNCLSSAGNDDLNPLGNGFYSSEVVDYCSVSPSRQLGTHDNLDTSNSNVFPADAGALFRSDLPPVQRASSSHAHILPCRRHPDVRHLFGDSRRSDTLTVDENDIQDTYISAKNLHQNPLQLTSAAAAERATNTILCATAAVFVPSSPAARALLFRNQSSFLPNATGLDTASVHTETPTLTPDSSETELLSSPLFSTSFEHVVPFNAVCTLDSSDVMPGSGSRLEGNDNDKILYTSPQLLEVKEGKKREQPLVQQTSCDVALHPSGPIVAPATVLDDPEEWYGLEYTLELSSRERQPSDTQSFSAGGEHSKSRESWAAIHRGTIHPFFEDEDYYQWKNWHRLLDKQDERRKHKKGFAFKAYSKELSCLFADEMRTRDVLYWQKGKYGDVAREVKERLNYITAHCPDPYFPPKKHDLGWYLKRSRSVGCIRELKAIEDGTRAEKRIAAGTLERKET